MSTKRTVPLKALASGSIASKKSITNIFFFDFKTPYLASPVMDLYGYVLCLSVVCISQAISAHLHRARQPCKRGQAGNEYEACPAPVSQPLQDSRLLLSHRSAPAMPFPVQTLHLQNPASARSPLS